jgi:hypothetical protein
MKKVMLIAAAVLSAASLSYAANALTKMEENHKCEAGFKCSFCNGTGWQGNFKCFQCKGTGSNSEY